MSTTKRVVMGRSAVRRITATRDRVRAVVDAYVAVARPIMLERYTPGCCVAASRIAINVLGAFGLDARPLVTRLAVYNRAWSDLYDSLGREPSVAEQLATGAFSRGIGWPLYDPDTRNVPCADGSAGYDGHVVVLTYGDTLMLDGSLDQLATPNHAIDLERRVTPFNVTPAFVEGREQLIVESATGVLVLYEVHTSPPPLTEEAVPDWRVNQHSWAEVAIIRAMERSGVAL